VGAPGGRPSGPRVVSRRLFLAGAVTTYPYAPDLDRPELDDDVARMMELLTHPDFGYSYVPVLERNPTAAQLRDALRKFCMAPEREPDDFIVLYLACHGELLDRDEFVLLPSDIDPHDCLIER
jgi:hypothetical protein